ncbi:DUF2326 domain-containing protein [Endozoicomonas elysicola]|uniref:DUF2326 domain-containing protein n=1 Tax=Endozoicomonas elysicola TaxID=305900 RepID=A0A081KB90_9GAMM|nr:DUF2326 domain-containing protein [Endozoicomonas elysicola]KEI71416.1 hypothetical protein GV64_12285 [Endozoicomonas elysicola]
MFKLKSLNSETNLFKEVEFRDGLNIILGEYTHQDKDINGIGKTTVVKLIDYCLLADGPKAAFFSEKYSFLKNHTVTLEFKLNEVSYRIKRDFKNKKIAYFSESVKPYVEYDEADLKLILFRICTLNDMYSGVFDLSWFRTIMSFFIQDDHSFLARDAKDVIKFISVGKRKSELLFLNMYLLGINNSNIWKFDQSKVELKQFQSDQTRVRKQITESSNKSVGAFRAEVDDIERKISSFEESLDRFEFGSSYSVAEEEISVLSKEITELNKDYITISKKLNDIKASLKISLDVDVDRITNLYGELSLQFSDFIKKEFDEVIQFREDLVANRSLFLSKRESDYTRKLSSIKEKIISLESRRGLLYKRLDEQNAFDSIKSAYKTLLEEKSSLDSKNGYLIQLDNIELNIAEKRNETTGIVADIVKEKNQITQQLESAKKIFLDIVDNSVDTIDTDVKPHLSFDARSHASSPINVSIEVPRSSSLGKGRFKILAYDLALFLNSCLAQRSLPKFLIHDGVFHGISHKTRINLLNYLDEKLISMGNVQYIITLNEDEITFPDEEIEKAKLNFNLEDRAIIRLEDSPSSMLFGTEFG